MWRKGRAVAMVMAGLSACSSAAAPGSAPGSVPVDDAVVSASAVAPAPAQEAARGGMTASFAGLAAPPGAATARMIVRSADLSLQVASVRDAVRQVSDATRAVDGFLGTSRLWRDGEADRARMTVRVPAARLDAMLAQFRGMAVRVDNESVTGEDVTRQAVDLTAQLTNLRATEVELRALLTTVRVKTQRAADVLEVHTELARVRGEIEQRTAELQTLTQLAALSTITIELRPDAVATPIAAAPWQPLGVLRDATRALVATARVAVNGLIWVVVYGAPMLLLVCTLVFTARRFRRRVAIVPQRG